MKSKVLLLSILLCFIACINCKSQNNNSESTYAVVQVIVPTTVFGDFKIRIFYGNDQIEDYKAIAFNKENKRNIQTYVVDALNYMDKKGYDLEHAIVLASVTFETQYILKKKEK